FIQLYKLSGLVHSVSFIFFHYSLITVDNRGKWGEWGHANLCPNGMYAPEFSLLVRTLQLYMCQISFLHHFCMFSLYGGMYVRKDKKGWCPSGPVKFKCDSKILDGEAMDFGEWGSWNSDCEQSIYGIQTKQEAYQGLGDGTALNDIKS
uniref:Uncharacterized protein n=1 Tax=Electrophorus electricus TaxID=8005 RepID=A0A4W4DSG8_ELEEL